MAVDKKRFEEMFDELVTLPLEQMGFLRIGKSIYLVQDEIAISLIRLGGRMALPGAISQVLCFRHSFLPNLDEEVNAGFEREVFAYPIKLKPLAVRTIFGSNIKYRPNNLNYETETFEFRNKTESQITNYLIKVLKSVKALFDWAKSITPEQLAVEINKHGESAWIEKLWLKSYASR
jgi:hypothetical protein